MQPFSFNSYCFFTLDLVRHVLLPVRSLAMGIGFGLIPKLSYFPEIISRMKELKHLFVYFI